MLSGLLAHTEGKPDLQASPEEKEEGLQVCKFLGGFLVEELLLWLL